MSRFARIVLCTAALVLCLVALPLASTGQEITLDSQGHSVTTAPPAASSPSPSVVKPDTAVPEGTVTIYSNFGSGYSYNCCLGWTETGPSSGEPVYMEAMAFTPTKGTYLLTQLDLAIGYIRGTNGYKLELRDDHEGEPGRKIASWNVTGLFSFGSNNTVETIKVRGLVFLLRHHQYWLVAVPNSDEWAAWPENTVGAKGQISQSTDSGLTWGTFNNTNGAFDVLGWKLF